MWNKGKHKEEENDKTDWLVIKTVMFYPIYARAHCFFRCGTQCISTSRLPSKMYNLQRKI